MRHRRPVTVGMDMRMPRPRVVPVVRRSSGIHVKKCYIITLHMSIEPLGPTQGLPMAMATAAARNGNGSETAARNHTNRAGMKGISQNNSLWKANRAQAMT